MKKSRKYIWMIILMNLIFSVINSCTEVELCYEENHPHTATLTFELNWEERITEKPEEVLILMSRIINTKHYVFPIQLNDTIVVEENENGNISGNDSQETEEKNNSYDVEGGEYLLFAVNKNENILDMQHIESFKHNNNVSYHSLYVSLPTFQTSGIPEMEAASWTDFNPNYPYIRETEWIFIGHGRENLYTGNHHPVTLSPVSLNQQIKIRFQLKPDPSIEVTKVIAEISGVVGGIKMLTLEVDETKLYRMAFMPEIVEEMNGILTYEGEINTLGILPNINGKEMLGSGILHLGIYVEKEGVRKLYHERINLINTLTKADLTLPLEDDPEKKKLNTNIKGKTLEIDSYLHITMEKISHENEGADKWEDNEGNYVQTEV